MQTWSITVLSFATTKKDVESTLRHSQRAKPKSMLLLLIRTTLWGSTRLVGVMPIMQTKRSKQCGKRCLTWAAWKTQSLLQMVPAQCMAVEILHRLTLQMPLRFTAPSITKVSFTTNISHSRIPRSLLIWAKARLCWINSTLQVIIMRLPTQISRLSLTLYLIRQSRVRRRKRIFRNQFLSFPIWNLTVVWNLIHHLVVEWQVIIPCAVTAALIQLCLSRLKRSTLPPDIKSLAWYFGMLLQEQAQSQWLKTTWV